MKPTARCCTHLSYSTCNCIAITMHVCPGSAIQGGYTLAGWRRCCHPLSANAICYVVLLAARHVQWQAGPAVMKSLVVEGALPYLPTYLAVWAGEQRDAPLIAATCRLVEQLVCQVRQAS